VRNLGNSTVLRGGGHPYRVLSLNSPEHTMPRYLVERTFPDTLGLPANPEGANACSTVVSTNAREGVTWVNSYVTPDRHRTYCIYDGPSPEAIRMAAKANGLPVDRITEVRVLDPYFLH
jgi:hypothetical protein